MPSARHDKMKDTENRVPRIASLPPNSAGSETGVSEKEKILRQLSLKRVLPYNAESGNISVRKSNVGQVIRISTFRVSNFESGGPYGI